MASNETGIVDISCDFLMVAINSILYSRRIYPPIIFERRKKCGVVVFESRHPLLNNYLSEVFKAIHFHLKAKQLRQLLLEVMSSGKKIETYVFDLLHLSEGFESDPLLLKLEENFRALYIKINTSSTFLNQSSHNLTFNINLVTTGYSAANFNENPEFGDFPWLQKNTTVRCGNPEVLPLHSINTENLKMQIFIEKMLND